MGTGIDGSPRLGAVTPLEPGDPRTIGRYGLTGRLGTGGMGTVYLGRALAGGPPVAVKVVHAELAADPEFRARFADEVAAARRVAPFCTARVLDADPAARAPYLVTEFVDGVPLSVAVSDGGPLDESTLHGVALGVAAALSAVHAAGVVHRDLKPANVLLSLSGPRVIDFGIARALDVARRHTQAGMLVGTPGWMAPEQFRGGTVGPAADVFSWGSLVAYAATGHNPWSHAQSGPVAVADRAGAPDPARRAGPGRAGRAAAPAGGVRAGQGPGSAADRAPAGRRAARRSAGPGGAAVPIPPAPPRPRSSRPGLRRAVPPRSTVPPSAPPGGRPAHRRRRALRPDPARPADVLPRPARGSGRSACAGPDTRAAGAAGRRRPGSCRRLRRRPRRRPRRRRRRPRRRLRSPGGARQAAAALVDPQADADPARPAGRGRPAGPTAATAPRRRHPARSSARRSGTATSSSSSPASAAACRRSAAGWSSAPPTGSTAWPTYGRPTSRTTPAPSTSRSRSWSTRPAHKHSADLTMRVVFRDQTIWNKIEPGQQVRGTMVFDIPQERQRHGCSNSTTASRRVESPYGSAESLRMADGPRSARRRPASRVVDRSG